MEDNVDKFLMCIDIHGKWKSINSSDVTILNSVLAENEFSDNYG